VGKYNLSAHADAAQMVAVLNRLRPPEVCLVHGDAAAREALAGLIPHTIRTHLVSNGESFELARGKPVRRSARPRAGLAPAQPFDAARLRDHLLGQGVAGRLLTAGELAELWYGDLATDERVEQVRQQLLSDPDAKIEADRRRPYLFRILSDQQASEREPGSGGAKRRVDGRLEQNELLSRVEKIFADDPTLYRKGVQTETGELTLFFHFPLLASQRHAELLSALQQDTGWSVKLSPNTHLAALAEAAERLLDEHPGWRLSRAPSVHHGQKVVLKLSSCPGLNAALEAEMSSRFLALTGHRLELQEVLGPAPTATSLRGDGRMEQNVAFTAIRKAFEERGLTVYRASLKNEPGTAGGYLEVSLISPQVARRHSDLLARLEEATRWTIRFHTEPNQDTIKRRAKELIPESWGLRKEPGFFKLDGLVRARLAAPPPPAELAAVSEQLERETGYRLELA
jgi:hypothetical protein